MEYSEIVDFIRKQFNTTDTIPLHSPHFAGNEKKYLLDCIDSTYVSSVGKYVDEFEKQFALFCGAKYAIATVNGTAALHLALIVANVKPNDLVLTQALSFVATSNAIAYTGASAAYIDVDNDTLGMSPEKLTAFLLENAVLKNDGYAYERASGKKISACVPMHTFGHPCRIIEIAAICHKYNIALLEDAAEAIGSYYSTKHCGTFGSMGVFSFNGNKTITSGGGGAIVTNDKEIALLAKHLSTQAKVAHPWEFKHDAIAYNYRMPNINAALACAQLEQLPTFLISKRVRAKSYEDFFASSEITFIKEPPGCHSNYWLCCILLKDMQERNAFLEFTNQNGIMTRPAWMLLNKLKQFEKSLSGNLKNSEEIENRLVCLPSSAGI